MRREIAKAIDATIAKHADFGALYVTTDSAKLAAKAAVATLLAISNGYERCDI